MLYEPTNIIPSTMTQTGTVAATTDNVNIQWQVNGNSAMTMFQIDVMQNNADSTFVYSTGVVTENPTVAQGYSLPFYGKDRFGDYVQFVYQPNQTWAAWSGNAILDGNSYKFRITQFFQENGTAYKVPITSSLSAGTTYYFSYSENGTTKYVSFTVANAAYFVNGNTIYFNFSHNAGWVATSGTHSRAITDITFSVSETQPSGTQLSGAEAVSSGDTFYNQFFTAQNSASSFITRTNPTLTITPLTETPVASATQSFTATYSQEQGDSINTVRWKLFNAEDMNAPIDDTGEISTSVLSYEYNGLFDGQSYTVICTVTTESGVTVASTLDFSVQYEQGTYTGDFTAQSLCHEDANLLKWDNIEGISGDDNPAGSAIVSNGQLILPENSTVTWSERENEDGEMGDLNFSAPWTAVWNGELVGNQPFEHGTIEAPWEDESQENVVYFCNSFFTFFQQKWLVALITVIDTSGAPLSLIDTRLYYYKINGNSISYVSYISIPQNGSIYPRLAYVSKSEKYFCIISDINVLLYSVNATEDGFSVNYLTVYSPIDAPLNISTCSGFSYDDKYMVINYYKNPVGSEAAMNLLVLLKIENNTFQEVDKYDAINMVNINTIGIDFYPNSLYLFCHSYFRLSNDESSHYGYFICNITDDKIVYTYASEYVGFNSVGQFNNNGTFLLETGGYPGSGGFDSEAVARLLTIDVVDGVPQIVSYETILDEENDQGMARGGGFSPNDAYIFIAIPRKIIIKDFVDELRYEIPSEAPYVVEERGAFWTATDGSSFCTYFFFRNTVESEYVWNTQITQYVIPTQDIFSLNNQFQISSMWHQIIFSVDGVGGNLPSSSKNCLIALTPSALQVYSFLDGQYLGMQETAITYSQQTISSAQLQGEQTCNYFSIIDGDGENIAQSLQDPDFVPQWNNAQGYTVDLLADFQYGLDGGTATETGTGFRIYRRKSDGTENIELATLPSTTLSLRDYGIKSNESYIYDFYVYDANGAFMGVRSTEATPLKRQFKRFSLLSTQYNESDNCYHVVKEYQFSCNIQDMTVSNNSNKSYVQNFTPYPTVFQSTANYASGTLQALIGFVDPKAYKYWDSTQLMDELNALSTTTNTLFLKDMKGHLWMVDVGTVQMTATQKTREMQVTISLPWTEIGDASDVSIIQTPDDEGWNYDAQVLDVKIDVDVETGMLKVVYPFHYYGTTFALQGDTLVGSTPIGVTSAVQPLPSAASQPTDGQLKAVVMHK